MQPRLVSPEPPRVADRFHSRLLACVVLFTLACAKSDEASQAAHAALYEPIALDIAAPTIALTAAPDTLLVDDTFAFLSVGVSTDLLADTGVTFGRVVDASESMDGTRLVVLDALERRVIVLDNAGQVLAQFGQRGRGPGDFELPASLSVVDSATIAVWDPPLQRLTFTSFSGEFVRSVSLPAGDNPAFGSSSTLALTGKRLLPWRGILLAEVHSDPLRVPAAEQRAYITRLDYAGRALDTLFEVAVAPVEALQRREGSATYTDWTRPLIFAPRLQWTPVSDHAIAVATGGRYEVVLLDSAGRASARIVRDVSGAAVSRADRLRFLQGEVDDRRAWAPPVVLERLFRGRFATERPAITELIPGDSGAVWVRGFDTQADPSGRGSLYEIVRADAGPPRAVRFPNGVSALRVHGNRVYAVRRLSTGAESIVGYRLPIEPLASVNSDSLSQD
jgi:hypothetical protein